MITLGYYAVTYCLGIHILNSFIGFISPLQDPEDEECSLDDKNSFLPQKYKINHIGPQRNSDLSKGRSKNSSSGTVLSGRFQYV